MPKARGTRAGRSKTADAGKKIIVAQQASPQIAPAPPGEPPLEASAILLQPIARGAAGPEIRARGAAPAGNGSTGLVSVLAYTLPEPTSYGGRNVIALDLPREIFRERPNESRQLAFGAPGIYVNIGNPLHLQGGDKPTSGLTIEAWVKPEAVTGWRHIVSHGQGTNKQGEVFFRINDGLYEFGTWEAGTSVVGIDRFLVDPAAIAVRAEDIGAWVHLAGVYDPTGDVWTLYRNGVAMASCAKQGRPPRSIEGDWLIGAMRVEEKGGSYARFWPGGIAEVRMWTVARTEAEIRRDMNLAVPQFAPGTLGGLWHLNEGSGNKALDSSGRELHGTIKGDAKWVWGSSPIGAVAQLRRQQPEDRVKQALKDAKGSGFFDPLVFPRIRGVMTETERRRSMEALSDLTYETFHAFYQAGQHLALRRGFSGNTTYAFVPTPPDTLGPQLMLVEEYRLSSFLGAYGIGRTLKTFSLLPGESTRLSIRAASRIELTAKQATSILDSYSQESASEFESSLAEERSNRSTSSEELGYHAEVEGSASWGFGSVSASAGVKGSTNSAREEFGKSVSNATSKHAAKASANRNVQIDTTSESKSVEERSSDIVREIENINVGRTLNFVFRQMNQEFVSLLHLVDVRVAYTSGMEPPREFPLHELPELLARVLVDDPAKVKRMNDFILDELRSIRDYVGTVQDTFVKPVDDKDKAGRYHIDRDFTSTYTDPTTNLVRTVPGIILSANSIVMRTEDVVVEALIGQSPALDEYAVSLQEEQIRERRLANDRHALENRLLEVEAERKALLVELVRNRDVETLKAFGRAQNGIPGEGAPKRVVGVWEAEPNA